MRDRSRDNRSHFRAAYTTTQAAAEYDLRHRRSAVRRWVSRREGRIVRRLLRAASNRPEPGPSVLVLDAPCGTGRITPTLCSLGLAPVALDSSEDMIRRGIERGTLSGTWSVAGSLFALPFAAGSFQAAVCARFLHHLDQPEARRAALAELRAAVDGPLVASIWTGVSFQWMRRSLRHFLGRRASARFRVSLADLQNEAAAAGWRLTRLRYLFRFISETAYVLLE